MILSLPIQESIIPGSAIKGATLYMGLNKKVVGIGEVIVDAPIKIRYSGKIFLSKFRFGQ